MVFTKTYLKSPWWNLPYIKPKQMLITNRLNSIIKFASEVSWAFKTVVQVGMNWQEYFSHSVSGANYADKIWSNIHNLKMKFYCNFLFPYLYVHVQYNQLTEYTRQDNNFGSSSISFILSKGVISPNKILGMS